jgi:hypothetical protein
MLRDQPMHLGALAGLALTTSNILSSCSLAPAPLVDDVLS